jgi:hypothetical protein
VSDDSAAGSQLGGRPQLSLHLSQLRLQRPSLHSFYTHAAYSKHSKSSLNLRPPPTHTLVALPMSTHAGSQCGPCRCDLSPLTCLRLSATILLASAADRYLKPGSLVPPSSTHAESPTAFSRMAFRAAPSAPVDFSSACSCSVTCRVVCTQGRGGRATRACASEIRHTKGTEKANGAGTQ